MTIEVRLSAGILQVVRHHLLMTTEVLQHMQDKENTISHINTEVLQHIRQQEEHLQLMTGRHLHTQDKENTSNPLGCHGNQYDKYYIINTLNSIRNLYYDVKSNSFDLPKNYFQQMMSKINFGLQSRFTRSRQQLSRH